MSGPIPFMSPRLVGARFEGHKIPLEVLKDLAVLDKLIVEVAKWQYLKDNPKRQKAPRGFTDGISFDIESIEDGSAIPKIVMCFATSAALLMPPYQQEYFEKARESIIAAIDAAESNTPIASHLPDNLLSYFDALGRNLRDGECIEFRPGNKEHPARLDKVTRKKLVLASAQVQEITEEITLRGTIPEANQRNGSFELLPTYGGPLIRGIPFPQQDIDTILKAFSDYRSKALVLLKGVCKVNRAGQLQSIEEVENISLLDPNDIPARMDGFRSLADGWLDGKGKAPSKEGLDWLSAKFESSYLDELPLPYAYPTAEGGVQLEWTLGEYEASLDISFESKQGEWHCLNMKTNEDVEQSIGLNQSEGWDWLNTEIKHIAGVAV